jgi:NAD(P)-dependent dehydrogenase (short-subunit alcohol dehydrogenase family)
MWLETCAILGAESLAVRSRNPTLQDQTRSASIAIEPPSKGFLMAQTILITGTNSGFGRLTALTLARAGNKVFGTIRDVNGKNKADSESLVAQGAGNIKVLEADLTAEGSIEHAVQQALAEGPIDVFVNNAGAVVGGFVETITPDELRQQFEINVVAPHRATRALLPAMRAQGHGLLVYVSSGVGRIYMPWMGAYVASKHALEALVDCYRDELAPTGIEMVLVQPGAFPTPILNKVVQGSDTARLAGYPHAKAVGDGIAGFMNHLFQQPNAPNPQEVADAIFTIVDTERGKRPARVVVDRFMGHVIEQLNAAHDQVQKTLQGPQ